MGAMIILIVFLLCVFTSVPIGFSIGLSVVAYALATGSVNMGYIASGLFASCDSFPLMAIPFFILSGALMEGGGLSKRLVLFFDSLVGRRSGHRHRHHLHVLRCHLRLRACHYSRCGRYHGPHHGGKGL